MKISFPVILMNLRKRTKIVSLIYLWLHFTKSIL